MKAQAQALETRILNYLINKTRPTPISVNPLRVYSPAHSITNLEAYQKLGTTSLAVCIMRLRRKGYPVTSVWIEVSNRYGQPCRVKLYTLDVAALNQPTNHYPLTTK